ncbi:MAG: S1 RNA-binding domain-containing protein, partial [Prevotella sp.]|nr:S1 RNA-binding domain-containing protein [Prevotella sp.]
TIVIDEIDGVGKVQVSAPDRDSIDAAIRKVKAIVAVPEVGEVYEGVVRSVMPYGCFVEIMPGKDGLLHISEIDWKRLESVEEAGLHEGDKINVKLLDIDPKTGKYKLSHRVLIPKPEGYVERERRPRPERPNRPNDRRNNDRRTGERSTFRPSNRPYEMQKNFEETRDTFEEREPRDFNDTLDHDFDF